MGQVHADVESLRELRARIVAFLAELDRGLGEVERYVYMLRNSWTDSKCTSIWESCVERISQLRSCEPEIAPLRDRLDAMVALLEEYLGQGVGGVVSDLGAEFSINLDTWVETNALRSAGESPTDERAKAELLAAVQFGSGALEHILYGEIRMGKGKQGAKAVGWHYEPFGNFEEGTSIVEKTRTPMDINGVYMAKVKIRNTEKDCESSFFPMHWNESDIEQAIREAYINRERISTGRSYQGHSADGLKIVLVLDENHYAVTQAWPHWIEV